MSCWSCTNSKKSGIASYSTSTKVLNFDACAMNHSHLQFYNPLLADNLLSASCKYTAFWTNNTCRKLVFLIYLSLMVVGAWSNDWAVTSRGSLSSLTKQKEKELSVSQCRGEGRGLVRTPIYKGLDCSLYLEVVKK